MKGGIVQIKTETHCREERNWCIGAWLHGHKREVTEQLQQRRHCLVLCRITGVKILLLVRINYVLIQRRRTANYCCGSKYVFKL